MNKTATVTISFGISYEPLADMFEEWGEDAPTKEQFIEYCKESVLQFIGDMSDSELENSMNVETEGFDD